MTICVIIRAAINLHLHLDNTCTCACIYFSSTFILNIVALNWLYLFCFFTYYSFSRLLFCFFYFAVQYCNLRPFAFSFLKNFFNQSCYYFTQSLIAREAFWQELAKRRTSKIHRLAFRVIKKKLQMLRQQRWMNDRMYLKKCSLYLSWIKMWMKCGIKVTRLLVCACCLLFAGLLQCIVYQIQVASCTFLNLLHLSRRCIILT